MSRIHMEPVIREAAARESPHGGFADSFAFLARWHGGISDEKDTFIEREEVALGKVDSCFASVSLALTKRGQWLTGFSVGTSTDWAGSPVCLVSPYAFDVKEEALDYEADKCREWFADKLGRTGGFYSEHTRSCAAELAQQIDARQQRCWECAEADDASGSHAMTLRKEKLKDAATLINRAIYDLKAAGCEMMVEDLLRTQAKIVAELDHLDAVKDHPKLF